MYMGRQARLRNGYAASVCVAVAVSRSSSLLVVVSDTVCSAGRGYTREPCPVDQVCPRGCGHISSQ